MKKPTTIITPKPESVWTYIFKTWKYRSLIVAFAKKDLKVKFAQTFLSITWAIIQPVTSTLVFAFFFGYILKWKTGDLPFPIYVLSGVIGWNLFTSILIHGTTSVNESAQLIRKIYFPKLIMPLSKTLTAIFESGMSFILLIILMIYYQISPSINMIFIPVIIALNVLFALSLVCLFGAFSYRRRDLLHLLPFISYFGIWLTPVFFTKETLPESLRFIWYVNPMAGIVDGWRACFFDGWAFDVQYLPAMLSIIPLAFISMFIYSRKENKFSDFI